MPETESRGLRDSYIDYRGFVFIHTTLPDYWVLDYCI